jgi:hypothetical protein
LRAENAGIHNYRCSCDDPLWLQHCLCSIAGGYGSGVALRLPGTTAEIVVRK